MIKNLLTIISVTLMCTALVLGGYLVTSKINNQEASIALVDDSLAGNSLVQRFQNQPIRSITPSELPLPKGVFQITKEQGLFPTMSSKNSMVIFYNAKTGELKSALIEHPGQDAEIIGTIKPGATSVQWAGNGTKLLATYSTGVIYYDLNTKTNKEYPTAIKQPIINKSGNQIAYTYFDQIKQQEVISIADPMLTTFRSVLPARSSDWNMTWLDENNLALSSRIDPNKVSIFSLTTTNKYLQNILSNQAIIDTLWSPDGNKLLYTYYKPTDKSIQLAFTDRTSGDIHDIDSKVTPSQCAWSIDSKTIYCLSQNTDKSEDKVSFMNPIKIDTSTISTPTILKKDIASLGITISKPFLSLTEDYILFANTADSNIYGLKMAQ